MREYLEFLNIEPSSKREEIFDILNAEDLTHPNFFASESITFDVLHCLGLTAGIIIQLKDHVSRFKHWFKLSLQF
ncbi:hypothetical protein KEM48_002402 [Puccinia striiformis f. sp. tritici PST-130]|nr:hypothetical protein KEM48_002402 [Puccinia striiformis f. sp. tritici PST-130]